MWVGRCLNSWFLAGFNPMWNESFTFTIHVPELALVRFMVEDYDAGSQNDFIGQYCLPLTSIQNGKDCAGKQGTKQLEVNSTFRGPRQHKRGLVSLGLLAIRLQLSKYLCIQQSMEPN